MLSDPQPDCVLAKRKIGAGRDVSQFHWLLNEAGKRDSETYTFWSLSMNTWVGRIISVHSLRNFPAKFILLNLESCYDY